MLVPTDRPLLEAAQESRTAVPRDRRNVANLVEDGATLQIGIGTIPNAVLRYLTDLKNLGVHTEMFSDGVIPLVE